MKTSRPIADLALQLLAGILPMELRYKYKPKKCRACGSKKIATIIYGDPAVDGDFFDKLNAGKIVVGGCVFEIDGSQPSWQCYDCQVPIYKKADNRKQFV